MWGRASALQNTHPRHRRCECGTGRSRNRDTSRRLQRDLLLTTGARQLARWLSTLRFVRARVLVADDQADVLEALRFLLKGADLEADFVTSPVAALERLQERPYELLLADLNYTRDTTSAGEGLELVSRARVVDPLLPVVVMTGWGTIDTAVEAMRRGARSFVQKPWNNTTLLEILNREIADGRVARQQNLRHEREQSDARAIQRGLLPSTLPCIGPYGIAAGWQPASGYGGDCYDALTFDEDVLGLLIADVAGKGLPAALLMSNLQAAVRAFSEGAAAPDQVCARVNRLLCGHMVSGRFVTACYVRLDCRRHVLTCANAGHNPPLLVRGSGEIVRLATGGTVLGVFPDRTYEQHQVDIRGGDRLVLYTDGITEATSPHGEEYGEERLAGAITDRAGLDAPALTAALFDDVLAFADGTLQDDATIVSVVVAA
jgi:phosphoserine phosphatase RsbU/P